MKHCFNWFLAVLLFTIMVTGCSAVGVPATFNPEKKLKYAEMLFNDNGRPLPAEPLIFEAIGIYKKGNDEVGLANAYQTYAYFLQSSILRNYEKDYRKHGFMDQTVTFDNRYEKALEYWIKSFKLFERNVRYAESSNTYYNIGRLQFMIFNNKEAACKNYSKSIASHNRYIKKYPDATVELDPRFDSFEGYINALRNEVGCY